MELSKKDIFDSEKRYEEDLNFHTPANVAADWHFGANQQTSFHLGNSWDSSSSLASASRLDSLPLHVWDHSRLQTLTCSDGYHQTSSRSSYLIPDGMEGPWSSSRSGVIRPPEYVWSSSSLLSTRVVPLQTRNGALHQNLSQFPADSVIDEAAARLSCFSSGSLGYMMNSFQNMEPRDPFHGSGSTHAVEVPFSKNVLSTSGTQTEEGALQNGTKKCVSLHIDHAATVGSLAKDEKNAEISSKMPDESKNFRCDIKPNGNGDVKANGNGQPREGAGGKKRKISQDADCTPVNGDNKLSTESAKEDLEKDDLRQSSAPDLCGKSAKERSKQADVPQNDYIHVRARRGQATNSHSLAERVRREKISERMKLLQDIVPGCSKVTGKAGMLDEIINYVQSLQSQVEFLSMKLSTVNPRLDFHLDRFLSRDLLPIRGISSSAVGFPDMALVHSQLHVSQQGLIPSGIPGVRKFSTDLTQCTNSQFAALNDLKEGLPQDYLRQET